MSSCTCWDSDDNFWKLYAATTGSFLFFGLVILLFVCCACRKARVRQTSVEPAATDYVSETKLKETEADLLRKIEELRMELRDATRLLASTKPETPSPHPPARRVPPGIQLRAPLQLPSIPVASDSAPMQLQPTTQPLPPVPAAVVQPEPQPESQPEPQPELHSVDQPLDPEPAPQVMDGQMPESEPSPSAEAATEEPADEVDTEAAEKAAAEKAAAEKAAAQKAAAQKAATEKAAREKAAREKAARDKAAREKAAKEKAERDKAAKEKAAKERAERREKAKKVVGNAGANFNFGFGNVDLFKKQLGPNHTPQDVAGFKMPDIEGNKKKIKEISDIMLDKALGQSTARITGACAPSNIPKKWHIVRAESIRDGLVAAGVPKDRLTVVDNVGGMHQAAAAWHAPGELTVLIVHTCWQAMEQRAKLRSNGKTDAVFSASR